MAMLLSVQQTMLAWNDGRGFSGDGRAWKYEVEMHVHSYTPMKIPGQIRNHTGRGQVIDDARNISFHERQGKRHLPCDLGSVRLSGLALLAAGSATLSKWRKGTHMGWTGCPKGDPRFILRNEPYNYRLVRAWRL